MKLKQIPADFRVEELADFAPDLRGEFAVYRLHKIGWTTPDALLVIARAWNLPWRAISYGGLKDRHADTTQFIAIHRGPQRDFVQERMKLEYLGQGPEPFSSRHIRANRFRVTLRDLKESEIPALRSALAELERTGVPNYFDDQRFGSVGDDGKFIGREMVFGRYEDALKMALAGPYEHDRAESKEEKRILLQHWNDWPACKAALPKGHARSLVDYLVHHPMDFKGAVARLRPELQGIYLSAYQSELWNRALAHWLKANVPAEQTTSIHTHRGELPAPTALPPQLADRWAKLVLPLPCPRTKFDAAADGIASIETVLAEEGVTWKKLKLPGLNKPYFSKGDRPALLRPDAVRMDEGRDELNRGRSRVTLGFELPRGAYATMVIKRIVGGDA